MPQIAYVASNTPMADLVGPVPRSPAARAFVEGLRERGWIDGSTIRIHWRSAEQRYARHSALFEEVVRLRVDLIATGGNIPAMHALDKTRTIPIVAVGLTDPLKDKIVTSIARPGGNLTGLMLDGGIEIESKRLNLLKQLAPRITRIAFLIPRYVGAAEALEYGPATLAAAKLLGLATLPQAFDGIGGVEAAVADAVRQRADALYVGNWSEFFLPENQLRVARCARHHALPAVYTYPDAAENGGLLGYGADFIALYRRLGYVVDRILRGANPGQIPIEQPTSYVMKLNMRTASTLGLDVPKSLLAAADRVIN